MPSASSEHELRRQMAGVLTRTLARSPVVRWILHARIRRNRFNDVAFVGDDFVEVKQVTEGGHLEPVALKCDFDTRIRAAKAFSTALETDDDDFIKHDPDESAVPAAPPQCIVLTTESNDLLFIHLADDGHGSYRFVQQACPMPKFDRLVFQPGAHLAIDPYSRAIAVAANEREVIIYSAKPKDRTQSEIQSNHRDWCPVSAQRPLQVEGVIQQIDFLYPPLDDTGSHNEDQIILLVIVVDQRRTRAYWIEWYQSSSLHHASVHRGQHLEQISTVPTLLIPLRNAMFLMVNGSVITKWKDILCGAATPRVIETTGYDSVCPGASPRKPIWANWCRPVRGSAAMSDTDYIYLIREDGRVCLLHVTSWRSESSHAGDFDCHVGTAFASLGSSRDPDILAVAGDMSNGQTQSIGSWYSPQRLSERSRIDTMDMEPIEHITNWATVTDMVTSTLPGKSSRARDGIFVTSCRQPYGAITELRRGLAARLSLIFSLDFFRSVTDLWTLPFASTGDILLLLSSPADTKILEVPADFDAERMNLVTGRDVALGEDHPTLAAAVTPDAKIVQITSRSVCLSPGTSANFEDCARVDCDPDTTITAASIDTSRWTVVVARRIADVNPRFELVCYALYGDDLEASGVSRIQEQAICEQINEPLVVATIPTNDATIACVATADGRVSIWTVGRDGSFSRLAHKSIPPSPTGNSSCGSIAIIRPNTAKTSNDHELVVACGLRDGRLYLLRLNTAPITISETDHIIEFSKTIVKLTQPPGVHNIAYAMSDADTCLLSWDDESSSSIHFESIWVSDKARPELAQGPIAACAHLPHADLLAYPDYAGSLVMISGDDFLLAKLEHTISTVPRQIPVSGTPNRLIYAEQQRCLVCASMKYDTRIFPSARPHGIPEERRQIWPVIDFVPSRSDEPSFTYDMQPGERVHALLEWSLKQGDDKKYGFILVGGSYTKPNGLVKGKITFLQPVNQSWAVVDVRERWSMKFDAPVYAFVLLDELRLVACAGKDVQVFGYSQEERRWLELCAPYGLASFGICVTTSGTLIYVSTNDDSLVRLELIEDGASDHPFRLTPRSMGPRADKLLSHLVLSDPLTASPNETTTLMTTKTAQLIALTHPSPTTTTSKTAPILFEAQLPRSLTRLRQCAIRPTWKPPPPPGVLLSNILGCAPDGTLLGIALLSDSLWRQLSWLQRLCEWDETLSPHSFQDPKYAVGEGTYARNERGMPIGLSARRGEVVMRTARPKEQDGHVDGDVLARAMVGGREAAVRRLRELVGEMAGRDDRAGEWVRRHLEEEMGCLEEVVEVLERVLDGWW